MKYIRNTGRYALSFVVNRKDKDIKVEFDRVRYYLDTGNLATDGITEVDDDTYSKLKAIKQFKALLDSKEFEELDEAAVKGMQSKDNAIALAEENKKLKEELDKQKKSDASKLAEENKKLKEELNKQKKSADTAKDAEIASLKQQLEALKKEQAPAETKGL